MKRTVLLTSVEEFVYIVVFAVLGVSLPYALTINGVILLPYAILWNVLAIAIWLIVSQRRKKKLRKLPLGSNEAWFFAIGTFFAIIGVGVSLITLSTFGAPTVGYSRCIAPENVNVTSPNCTRIENVNLPPSGGLYSGWGPVGAFSVILGVLGLPSFLVLGTYNYLQYGRRNNEQPTQKSNILLEDIDNTSGNSMDLDTERMKIDIVANYTTTAYTNIVVLCFTVLLTAFAAFFAPFVAKQITLIEFIIPFLAAEMLIIWVLLGQYQKFNRRTKYLDTLISKIESNPPVRLGALESILEKVRKQ